MLPRFVSTLPDGVSRSGLPTPFRVGRVNCYLLTDPPATLIDPGTLEPGSLDALATFLHDYGLGFSDVEQIVITHGHPDHYRRGGRRRRAVRRTDRVRRPGAG